MLSNPTFYPPPSFSQVLLRLSNSGLLSPFQSFPIPHMNFNPAKRHPIGVNDLIPINNTQLIKSTYLDLVVSAKLS